MLKIADEVQAVQESSFVDKLYTESGVCDLSVVVVVETFDPCSCLDPLLAAPVALPYSSVALRIETYVGEYVPKLLIICVFICLCCLLFLFRTHPSPPHPHPHPTDHAS